MSVGRLSLAWFAVAFLLGCGPDAREQRVLVFAAASLREAFDEIAARFEATHPGVDVDLHLAGTSQLAFQIEEGAPADVFASADLASMDRVVAHGCVVGEPRDFARNELAIVTPVTDPGGVTDLAAFGRRDLRLALCAPEVPAGQYARQALALAAVSTTPSSDEPHVKAVLSKVELGEVDAGIVYRTDVIAAGARVRGVEIPQRFQVEARYPIAALARGGGAVPQSESFVAFVLGDEGQSILRSKGFRRP